MKARITIRKSRSPSKGSEGDISDEEEKHYTKVPTPFFVHKKAPRILQNNSADKARGGVERKARSSSPKQVLTKNTVQSRGRMHQSPIQRTNSPAISRAKPLNTSKTKKAQSPYGAKNKMSPGRTQLRMGPEHKQVAKNTSPLPGRTQLLESDEVAALKALARKKRVVNKALWEAAENGDIVKITQLLEP
eukprot:TRINITY_DN1_c1698_g1_i1.p1 TRINITY_DN1_c1698_g1~~TRINITY_DN1_c1698_g1_i1.p1  ORF type:complete len:190 (+),score=39.93 TRINITY_DN1_c1698_g1_i1:51-620(+)